MDFEQHDDIDRAVELYHATKVYGSKHTSVVAVNDVSLHVELGEIIVIMGPSGSGKTTLIQLIGALLTPTSGDVIINGRNLNGLSKKELSRIRREEIGFVFQSPNLLSALTAIQNVEVVLNLAGVKGANARYRAEQLLKQMGLGERVNHRPSQLSGGEQQRVAIARALANNPQIILADEPTANLDSKTGHEVIRLLRNIAKEQGKTIIIATHDLRIRDLADRVLWLEDGKISVRWSDGFIIDPVCLMLVNRSSEIVTTYEGKTFHFCTRKCKERFEENPAAYANRGFWEDLNENMH